MVADAASGEDAVLLSEWEWRSVLAAVSATAVL
jgi:hypothetical protein